MTMPDGTIMTVPADAESLYSNAAYTTMVPRDDTSIEVIPIDSTTCGAKSPNPTVSRSTTPAQSTSDAADSGAHGQRYSSWYASSTGAYREYLRPTNCTSTWNYARRTALLHRPYGSHSDKGGTEHQQQTPSSSSPPRPQSPSVSSFSYYQSSNFQNHKLTTSHTVPQVTAAPSIDIRASQPQPASTKHSAFRLRARNPFVLFGWQSISDETVAPTPTSHL